MVGADHFVGVFVDTPLDVCESRDTKRMYAAARRGEVRGFTGIDDPYKAPLDPEITLGTADVSVEDNARAIHKTLRQRGFIRRDQPAQDAAGG